MESTLSGSQKEAYPPKYSLALKPAATVFAPQNKASKLVRPVVSNQLAETHTLAK